MSTFAMLLPWSAAADLLNPVRRLCDPTHRYEYEIYCRLNHIEVVAIDHGPKSESEKIVSYVHAEEGRQKRDANHDE